MKYNPSAFESKWQKRWEENNIFKREADTSKEKYYCLEMLLGFLLKMQQNKTTDTLLTGHIQILQI